MRAWLALVKDNMWLQNTACLVHIVPLTTKYECPYHETYIKLLLNQFMQYINCCISRLTFSLFFCSLNA